MGKLIYMDNSGREIIVPFGPEQPLVTIGRATDCTIRSNRKSVSRHHAEFRYNNGQYEVVDLGSSNGTYLIVNDNRQPVKPRVTLTHNDEVWCGDFILHFEEIAGDYDLDMDSDPTFGDGHPVNLNHQGGFGGATGYPPPPTQGQHFGAEPYNPGGVSFNADPYPPQNNGGYGAEPYTPQAEPYNPQQGFNPDPYAAQPLQSNDGYSSNDGYGAEPYNPSSNEYYPPSNNAYQNDYPPEPPPAQEGLGDYRSSPMGGGNYERGYQSSGGYNSPNQSDSYPPATPNNNGYKSGPNAHFQDQPHQGNDTLGARSPEPWEASDTSLDGSLRAVQGPRTQEELDPIKSPYQPSPGYQDPELQNKLDKQARELKELHDMVDHRDKELANLRANQQGSREEEERLKLELESARQEQRRLEEKLHTAHQDAARGTELGAELEQLRKKNSSLDKDLTEARDRVESYRRRVTQAEEEAARASRLRDDLRDRERDIEKLQDELATSREEIRTARDEARKSRESAERTRASLQSAERNVQDASETRRELDRHKRLLDEFERRNRELQQDFNETQAELKQTKLELEARTAEITDLKTLASNHEKRLSDFSKESTKVGSDLKKTRSALDEARQQTNKLDQQNNELQTSLSELQASSSSKIQELETSLATAQQTLGAQLEELTSQRDEARGQRDELLEELEKASPALRALKNEVEGLKQRLRLEKERKREGSSQLKTENADLRTQVAQLQEQYATANSALADAQQQLDDARLSSSREVEALQQRLDETSHALDQERQSPRVNPAQLEQMREQNAELQARLRDTERQLRELSLANANDNDTIEVPAIAAAPPAATGAPTEVINTVHDMLGKLDRVIDAIARTDLTPLNTIDRIRLQSALRDTAPNDILRAARNELEHYMKD